MTEQNLINKQDVILELKNLKKYFPIKQGIFKRTVGYVKAVDGVSLNIRRGETVALVGESGCGKSTLGRCILKIHEATAGEINYYSKNRDNKIDVTEVTSKDLLNLRREIQTIFQDPYSALNPRMNILQILTEPYKFHDLGKSKVEIRSEIEGLLEKVGLRPSYLSRFPHEFSGGQRQRVAIARALTLNPDLIVADEPVSALDVSIQGQTINLMKDLQNELNLTYLFISHDIALVDRIADRVAVMYLGNLVEVAETSELVSNVSHPYTEALLSAVPIADPSIEQERIPLSDEIPSPSDPPSGCPFHTRCIYAEKECREKTPELKEIEDGHYTACHFAEELDMQQFDSRAV
ncbi:oligopeptide/dipeptide ABC transporter, ATP-binding protein [Halobacteroides halobius DSM 5150]|uniref:Oligopeptide/dipeptide ABC transporter, ATP-binding protein n=1 Tax=Halobacteroides halobius (strain ATCC 35273 / DSM 5150 / MD-1) TaxID=748449 RepID=L0KE94_HALHC|nr:oligopeptide/dipeptide ABC transporter ATP-binding protein [Halobacteroides halobius]AGB42388.1 oligopeptide/dipeptide ABC transporter, ATP-binding protein [Halobacteroides halobius DSM 5150]